MHGVARRRELGLGIGDCQFEECTPLHTSFLLGCQLPARLRCGQRVVLLRFDRFALPPASHRGESSSSKFKVQSSELQVGSFQLEVKLSCFEL